MSPDRAFSDDLRELIRLARGDATAFEKLHADLQRPVQSMFLRRARRADLAEELAQQTWMWVWRLVHLRRYDPARARISTLVYAVARHVWLQHCRRQRRTPPPSESVREPVTRNLIDPLRIVQHAELLEALRACIENRNGPYALDESERRIVQAVAQSQTERQTASALGLAASTVNVRKQRAYDKLRRCLAAKGFGPDSIEQSDLLIE